LLRAAVPDKDFVGGETFHYLGRSYRLAFLRDIEAVTLKDGRLQVPNTERADAERLLRQWYTMRGQRWLPARLAPWCERVGCEVSELRVLDLGYRWASLSEDGSLNMHWQAMALPPNVIDYLLVHELAHFEHPHHDRAFWRAVVKTMPDAEQRREWLRRHGGGW
jgi:predicted metal-dependent hydrolase